MEPTSITSKTRLYAVIGNPVAHSLSPLMHNTAFGQLCIDAVYLAFEVADVAAAVSGIRAMGIQGLSVTIPHKIAIMDHLDEVSPEARVIGAVNTIINRNGRLFGDNSDGRGAVAALKRHTRLKGRHLTILGAGGAARAVAFAAAAEGSRVTIVNRTPSTGEALACAVGGRYRPLTDAYIGDCDILVNTTPVGMTPHDSVSPVSSSALNPAMIVMDAVYSPLDTRLLQDARRAGCHTIDGLDMFVEQGVLQCEWWTGHRAPAPLMKSTVATALMRRQTKQTGEKSNG
ncbi:MAG: shikimate dehydrogenase [Pseudomonadota bacterium]